MPIRSESLRSKRKISCSSIQLSLAFSHLVLSTTEHRDCAAGVRRECISSLMCRPTAIWPVLSWIRTCPIIGLSHFQIQIKRWFLDHFRCHHSILSSFVSSNNDNNYRHGHSLHHNETAMFHPATRQHFFIVHGQAIMCHNVMSNKVCAAAPSTKEPFLCEISIVGAWFEFNVSTISPSREIENTG